MSSIMRRRRGLISAIGNSCLMRWFTKPTLSDRRPRRQPLPTAKRFRSIRILRLPSGVVFDPVRQNVFCALVEEGERLKLGIGRWKDIPRPVRETCVYPAWKASNNGLAFGDLARTDVEDLVGAATEEVTIVHDSGEIRVDTAKPESPGPSFCMPLAALVTSSARLLLATLDALVATKG